MDKSQTVSRATNLTGSPVRGKQRVLERYNAFKLGWLHDSIHFVVLSLVLFVLFRFVIGFAIVGGDSMLPNLHDGEMVVYLRIVPEYRPGDVISMRVPAGEFYVKRVVAVGGDVVDLRGGQLLVNGKPIDADRGIGSTEPETGAVIYPYAVRPGNVFVLGDNREVSMDSRAFGEVNLRQIKGKILLQIRSDGIRRTD